MNDLMSGERLIDIALVVVGVELAVLIAVRERLTPGMRILDLLGQILAGVLLLLALRSALTGGNYYWTIAFVTFSFPAHLFDLARRARSSAKATRSAPL